MQKVDGSSPVSAFRESPARALWLRRLPASRELAPLEYGGVAYEIREIAEQLQQERGSASRPGYRVSACAPLSSTQCIESTTRLLCGS